MKKILSLPFIGFINITSNNPMKRTIPFHHLFISTVLATLLAVAPVTFAAQGPAKPAVKNTFWQVSKHLEMGGSHFQYQSHEQVRDLVDLMLEQIPKQAEGEPEGMAVARTIVQVMEQLRGEFGLGEISGTGASSFALAKDLARNRTFTHHYPGQNKGLLWRLFGTQPHVQKVLEIMPRETAALFHTDLDLKSALDWMSAFLKKNHPAQEKMFTEQIDQLNQTIGLQRLLASYGGEAGAAIVLDKAEKLNLPPGTPAMPMPGLLMMLKVKDDTLRMFLEGLIVGAKLGETVKVNGTDMTVMQLPPDANPLQQFGLRFQPALFQAGEYLVLASDPGLATRVMATAKGNVPGLMAAASRRSSVTPTPIGPGRRSSRIHLTGMARITRFAHANSTTSTTATTKRSSTTRKPIGSSGRISPMTRSSQPRKPSSRNGCRKPTPSTSVTMPPKAAAQRNRHDRRRKLNRPAKPPCEPTRIRLIENGPTSSCCWLTISGPRTSAVTADR